MVGTYRQIKQQRLAEAEVEPLLDERLGIEQAALGSLSQLIKAAKDHLALRAKIDANALTDADDLVEFDGEFTETALTAKAAIESESPEVQALLVRFLDSVGFVPKGV